MMDYYSHAETITPSDTAVLNPPCFAFTTAVAGTVTFFVFGDKYLPGAATSDTTSVQIYASIGVIYPIRCSRIMATGTSATGIVGLW
jgi:hypothetical protein